MKKFLYSLFIISLYNPYIFTAAKNITSTNLKNAQEAETSTFYFPSITIKNLNPTVTANIKQISLDYQFPNDTAIHTTHASINIPIASNRQKVLDLKVKAAQSPTFLGVSKLVVDSSTIHFSPRWTGTISSAIVINKNGSNWMTVTPKKSSTTSPTKKTTKKKKTIQKKSNKKRGIQKNNPTPKS